MGGKDTRSRPRKLESITRKCSEHKLRVRVDDSDMLSAQKCHYHLVIKLHYSLDFESIPFLTLVLGRDTDQLGDLGKRIPGDSSFKGHPRFKN